MIVKNKSCILICTDSKMKMGAPDIPLKTPPFRVRPLYAPLKDICPPVDDSPDVPPVGSKCPLNAP